MMIGDKLMGKIMQNVDVLIVGAGPSGLCFAQMLANSGLRIAVLEKQHEDAIANPAFDGREIAITHRSARLMRELGVWQHIEDSAISPLRDAKVLNGGALNAMLIDHRDTAQHELGYLISNCVIRKAAYAAVKASPSIKLMPNVTISQLATDEHKARVTLNNGQRIEAQLVVAADNRFSETRRLMGISASMHDFGKTMMVCVMAHTINHQHTAWEWFDYGQTLALLPMQGGKSSVVITLPPRDIARLMAMPEEIFNVEIETRFGNRLGQMRLVSTRHAYPLVTVYSDRFVAQRFALIGDAAVGMHPVTAHGFNFALRGSDNLATAIKKAAQQSADIASTGLLSGYEKFHQRTTRPLFMATHAIAKIYSNDRLPARIIRSASLRIGSHLPPFKRAMANMLTDVR